MVLPRSTGQVAATVRACADAGVPFVARGSGTGLSGGALPHAEGVLIVLSQMRDIRRGRPGRPARGRRARRHQPAGDQGGRAARLLLRARPVQPADLLDRRQRGRELRRRALPEVRLHHQPRHSASSWSRPDGDVVRLGGRAPDPPGYDLLGAFVGSRGHARRRHRGDRPAGPRAGDGAHPARRASRHRRGRRRGVGASSAPGSCPAAIEMMDALAIEAAEAAVHCGYPQGAGAVLVVELDGPARRGGGAVRRGRAALPRQRRLRDPDRRRRRRAGAVLEGPQVGVRRGRPDQPGLHRAGRRHPAHRAARGAAADRRAGRRRRACGSPTSSTPATATCTRWCSSTTRCPARPRRAEEVSGAILDLCIEHGGSITGEHGVGVGQGDSTCRGCSPTTTSTRCRCCAAPSTRSGCPTPARSSRRRGCAASGPAGTRAPHPLQQAGLAEVF